MSFLSPCLVPLCLRVIGGGGKVSQRDRVSKWGEGPSLELPCAGGPFPSVVSAQPESVFLGDGQPHPVPFDPGALWLCPLHALKTLTAQAVYSSSGTFQGVEALGPSYKGLGAQDASPRNTTPQSPPAPDACRLHTSKDIKQPELSSSRCLQLHCLPSLGKELPIHFLAGTPDPPRSPLFGFRDGK